MLANRSFRRRAAIDEGTAAASAGPTVLTYCAKLSSAPASSPLNWEDANAIPIILAVVVLALCGCNANQTVNPSGEANRCANDPTCNPYNPSSYAQNNVGIGR